MALAFGLLSAGETRAAVPAGFQDVALVSGLSSPTTVDWAPDGRMFIAELGGRVKVKNPGSTTVQTLFTAPTRNQGLTGLSVDKDFATNGYLWVAYTEGWNGRVARVKVNPNNTVDNPASPLTVVLGKVHAVPYPTPECPAPSNTSDCLDSRGAHAINSVRSDPEDGTLWISNGDGAGADGDPATFRTYDDFSYAGKILHVDRNGRGLPGHPFCPTDTDLTHVCTKVWAKGFRNPYRFTFNDAGLPVVGDVGNVSREELDVAQPGRNYGWPCYEGDIRSPGWRDMERCATEYAKEGTSAAALPPFYSYVRPPQPGASIVAGPFYEGGYPSEYQGDLFFADYVLGFIKRLEFDSAGRVSAVRDFATGLAAPVDLKLAPNGNLVYADLGVHQIREIRSTVTQTNQPPVARITANPTSGPAPLTVNFNGSSSSDPQGSALTYSWDFGDGTSSTAANPSHTYTDGTRNFTATLTVRDPQGLSDSETITISPGNTPPTASITAPSTWRAGQTISVSGSTSDAQQGSLPASAYEWSIRLVHIDHDHAVGEPSGVTSTSFVAGSEHDSDSYYEARLTVTDARGLKGTDTARIDPETSQVSIDTSPSGGTITYGGADHATPFSKQATIGYQTAVSAVDVFQSGGRTYQFDSWSDGVTTRARPFTVPAAGASLVARYREAAVTQQSTLEAEKMTLPANARVYWETGLSGGAGVAMFTNGALSKSVSLPSSGRVTVRASGQQCGGAPTMAVLVDGAQVMSAQVPTTGMADYGADVNVPAGTHEVRVAFTNDLYQAGVCDRNLRVDKVTFSSASSGGGGDVTPPAAPSGLVASPGDGQVALDWANNSESDLAGYRVFRATTAGGPYTAINTTLLTGSSLTDTGRTNGTRYFYVVRAVDAAGNVSPASAEVSATPQAVVSPGTPVVIEGESMSRPTTARVYWQTGLSGGAAVKLFQNGRLTASRLLPSVASVTIRARGDQCAGAPLASLLVDGVAVASHTVSSTVFTDYTATVPIGAGTHDLAIAFTNDHYQAGVCDRNLDVDKVTFSP
ncbi:MAG TPA: carbohydrate-binding domain-containing protein [Thermoleophilaceae bacterium]|nr:carbohydrate-binding domain-containing protein [Thermoleophilaceae bacterium]